MSEPTDWIKNMTKTQIKQQLFKLILMDNASDEYVNNAIYVMSEYLSEFVTMAELKTIVNEIKIQKQLREKLGVL